MLPAKRQQRLRKQRQVKSMSKAKSAKSASKRGGNAELAKEVEALNSNLAELKDSPHIQPGARSAFDALVVQGKGLATRLGIKDKDEDEDNS